jgi:hypothetical protein
MSAGPKESSASWVPIFSASTATRAGALAAVGFGIVAAFQLLLALGAPWGRAALGGSNEGTLPPELRVVSSVSMAVFVAAAAVVLGRAGFWGGERYSGAFRVGTWALVVILPLGAVMNLASSSPWERFGWAPFTALLTVATFITARSRSGGKEPVPSVHA